MPEHDDGADRSEAPTPRRREEARAEGQIVRSVELTAAASLMAAILLLKALGPLLLGDMLNLTRGLEQTGDVRTTTLWPWIELVALTGARWLAPLLLLLVAVAIGATVAQSGVVLAWTRLALKPERLDPVAGARRIFSTEALARLIVGLLKVGLVSWIGWYTISTQIGTVLSAGAADPAGMFALCANLVYDLALRLGLVLLILGVADYLFQRWQHEKKLRMTKQEVRDELKRMEGDPLLKQRRRQMQTRLAMQRIRSEVPKADVVVTNPTEYAVALRYDEKTMTAPRVVAKGRDYLALQIRQVAQQHGVPIVARPPLARALYTVEVGEEVPAAHYRAVAEVLAYVYQLARKAS